MSFKRAEKRKRNNRIRQYKIDHPDMTQDAIAGIFHISQAKVSRILKDNGKVILK